MSNEGSAPMTAYESGSETILLRREMGGDEGKDVQRNTVYGSERVLPLADSHQRGRDILVELRNLIGGEATESQSAILPDDDLSQRTTGNVLCASVPR